MELLRQLVEGGVLGVLAYLGMGVMVVAVARRPIRGRDPYDAPVGLWAAAAAVCFIVVSTLFDVMSFPHVPYIFLWTAALLAVIVGAAPGEPPRPSPCRSGAQEASARTGAGMELLSPAAPARATAADPRDRRARLAAAGVRGQRLRARAAGVAGAALGDRDGGDPDRHRAPARRRSPGEHGDGRRSGRDARREPRGRRQARADRGPRRRRRRGPRRPQQPHRDRGPRQPARAQRRRRGVVGADADADHRDDRDRHPDHHRHGVRAGSRDRDPARRRERPRRCSR